MKQIHLLTYILSFLIFWTNDSYAQGANCASANPFCTSVGATFPASTNTTAQAGADYGCLGSEPNPAWYYLQIGQAGNIDITLTNSANVDIDFICWGPYTSPSGGCLPNNSGVDCSYSSAATEVVNIPNAQVGEYYLLLITNFSGQPTDITASQTGGAGATDCSIVNPSCTMNTLTASVTSCSSNPFLEFVVGGTVTYTDPPTSGQLIVEDCYGQQQVFNPPFGTSQTYSISGLPQDGLACNITAYFTADPACTITTPVTAPSPITNFSANCVIGGGGLDGTIEFSNGHTGATLIVEVSDGSTTVQDVINMPASSPQNWSVAGLDPAVNPYTITYYFSDNPSCSQSMTINCGCSADGGTETASVTGDGLNNYILCENDQLDINTNNDFTYPDDNGPIGGYAYQPGLAYLIYSCPPTPGVFPGSDPCFEGIVPVLDDLQDFNDGSSFFQQLGGAGTFANNEIYYTPITLYHYDPVAGNYIVNSNCWDIGDVVQVTYLNPIQENVTPDCQTATVTVTLQGGYPEIYGGSFTASNLSPATASFANTTCTNGGNIVISGLQNGDMYSFDVVDANGCPITISGGPFQGTPTANAGTDDQSCSLTYSLNATASFGTGTWTGPAGSSFSNATSPTSSVTVNTAGTYTFTWTEDNGGGCTDSDDVTVAFSDIQYTQVVNQSTCGNADGSITLNANSGIPTYTYSIDNGSTTQASGSFTSLGSGNYNIVVEDAIGCQSTGTIAVTDLGGPTIDAINGNDISCNAACDGDISISSTGGTQFSIDNGANFQAGNTFNSLCAGTYNIVVQDAIGCPVTGTITLTEPAALTHSTSKVDLICANQCDGQIVITATGGSSPYQYSIDNGTTNQSNGTFNNLCGGTYDILLTDAGGCTSTSQVTLSEPNPLSVTIGITDATCFGQCNGMMNSIPAGGTGPGSYNYSWTPAVGGNVPLVTNLCAGSYDLTITDGNGCILDTNGIVVGAPTPVTIDNVVTVDETCGGDCTGSITINATGASQFSIDGITYSGNNVFSSICAGNYTVYAQDVNGCSSNDQATILGPTPVQVVANGSTTICIGQSTPLTSVGSGGVGNYTYAWDNSSTTQNINVSPTNTQSYCVTATDGNGCTSQPACVTVAVNPALNVTALADQPICAGESAQISALGTGGNGGPYTYTWDQGVGIGQNQSVSPTFTTVYTVTLSDGCTTPNASASVTITVNTVPNISFSADTLEGCFPVSSNFTEVNVPAGSQCLWSFGDGGTSTDCSNSSYVFEHPGCWDITLQITTPDGCQTSNTISDYICVYDYPDPQFTFEPQPTTILEPTISFANFTPGSNNYTWTFDTQGFADQSTQVHPSYTFTNVGNFEVCLEAVSLEGCPNEICDTVTILEEFIVYVPNAFTPDGDDYNDEFMPIISGIIPESYEFMVFNRWGELIFNSQIPGTGWDGTYKGLMSQEDVYVWKLKVEDQVGEPHDYVGHVTLVKQT